MCADPEQEEFLFTELSKDAQELAVEDYNNKSDLYWETDMLKEDFEQILKEHGFPTKVYWSLGHCQGDGVAFEGHVDIYTWADKYLDESTAHIVKQVGYRYGVSAKINHHGNYYHECSMRVDYDYSYDTKENPELGHAICHILDSIEQILKDSVTEMSLKLRKIGYDYYEDVRSFEYVSETLIANEYLFDEDGNML